MLSKAEQAGLLSLAERNGLTLTFIEESGEQPVRKLLSRTTAGLLKSLGTHLLGLGTDVARSNRLNSYGILSNNLASLLFCLGDLQEGQIQRSSDARHCSTKADLVLARPAVQGGVAGPAVSCHRQARQNRSCLPRCRLCRVCAHRRESLIDGLEGRPLSHNACRNTPGALLSLAVLLGFAAPAVVYFTPDSSGGLVAAQALLAGAAGAGAVGLFFGSSLIAALQKAD